MKSVKLNGDMGITSLPYSHEDYLAVGNQGIYAYLEVQQEIHGEEKGCVITGRQRCHVLLDRKSTLDLIEKLQNCLSRGVQ